MAQMGDESEDETPDNDEDDGKGFLLSDDGKDIDLRYDTCPILSTQCVYGQTCGQSRQRLTWLWLQECLAGTPDGLSHKPP